MGKGKANKGKGGGGAPAASSKKKGGGANRSQPLSPKELSFDPNAALCDRPVVALTAAVLCGVAPDLKLVADHRRRVPGLGLSSGGEIAGDLAAARHLCRTTSYADLGARLIGGDDDVDAAAVVDQWVDYAAAVVSRSRDDERRLRPLAATLGPALEGRTFLCGGPTLTLADLAVFRACGWPARKGDAARVAAAAARFVDDVSHQRSVARWIDAVRSHPAVREATQSAVGVAGKESASFDDDDDADAVALVPGMNALEGATPGRVCTRFPPEPSGYLHVGHAKAALLNDYYARHYDGRLVVRFDDTNPSKEKGEYQDSIAEDLRDRLKIHPNAEFTFTSDYFDVIRYLTVERLIKTGKAYMDDTPQEEMQKQRFDRVASKYRDSQTPEQCLAHFEEMCSGSEAGAAWCLRIKMDMSSDNGTLRDPVAYRQNTTPHHRTGTTFKAYPTYDLACPIVDSLEGVTHALRTTEYNDRDEQYARVQRALGLRRSRVHAFARMNFVRTELSKRKLAWFVEQGLVTGWDDARFPTIRGVVRRGVDVRALKNFVYGQGASRRVVNMEWSKFWAENKRRIDATARRFMAIDATRRAVLTVENAPTGDDAFVETECHPKNPALGKRRVRTGREILLERIDAEGVEVGEEIVLMRWGVVKITAVDVDDDDEKDHHHSLVGTFVPDGDVRAAKRKLSWLAKHEDNTPCVLTEFDDLIAKDRLEPEDDFKDFVNPNTMATSDAVGDAALRDLKEHDVVQLERRGYYRVDQPYSADEQRPLVLYMIPDGKAKAMSGLEGKLAHR